MKALIVVDAHFYKLPDGSIWSKTIYSYDFWDRYLSIFEEIRVVARVLDISTIDTMKFLRVDGKNVEIFQMPFFRGPKKYLLNRQEMYKLSTKAIDGCDTAIFRIPSSLSFLVYKKFKKTKKPFGVEVVADPWESLALKFNKSLGAIIARFLWTKAQKEMCSKANGVSYVTEEYLQKHYPSQIRLNGKKEGYFETNYSTIDLKDEFFGIPKTLKRDTEIEIVHTANNINNYVKGHDSLIKALSILHRKGYKAKVTFIGDGDKRKEFINLAESLGVEENISFTGMLSDKEEIRQILLRGSLFVFPTRAEGLPRAVIEAMAVGLPCVSTKVSGIPELVENKYLVDPEDITGLAEKIVQLITDQNEYERVSSRNINKAQEYNFSKLAKKRSEFYIELKKMTNLS